MTTGHAKTLIIHMSMEGAEMTALKIDLKQLNVFVGANGVGKSLVLKLSWVMQMVAQLVVGKQDLEAGAQFILDNSVPDHDMMGAVVMEFETGAIVSIHLLNGKVDKVEYSGFEKIDELSSCTFMSTEMRLFTGIKHYLFVRSAVGGTIAELIPKLVKHFKLYDILYVEGLIQRMPMVLDESTRDRLEAFDVKGLTRIEFTGDDFIGVFDNRKQPLSNLGNGHQALINMTLASVI